MFYIPDSVDKERLPQAFCRCAAFLQKPRHDALCEIVRVRHEHKVSPLLVVGQPIVRRVKSVPLKQRVMERHLVFVERVAPKRIEQGDVLVLRTAPLRRYKKDYFFRSEERRVGEEGRSRG